MADALGAGQQRIEKLLSLHAAVAVYVFKPFSGVARGVLYLQHLDRSHGDIVLQGLSDVIRRCQTAAQLNRVFQRQLAATAD